MNNPRPVIILIHGATLNGRSWGPVQRLLEPHYRVLAPDLPGHGARRGEPFTLQGAVDTIVAAARSVAPAPLILAGDSLGGFTAQASARALPREQLKGLVLGGSSHNLSGMSLLPYLAKAATFGVLLMLFNEKKLVDEKFPKVLLGMGFEKEEVAAILAAGLGFKAFTQAVRGLAGIDFRSQLAAIPQPVMFINGDLDKVHVRGEAHFVAAARHATVHRFADCEHGVSLLRRPEFAALVQQFADRAFA